jgi:tetratricopeptide (TPR) repeat protein
MTLGDTLETSVTALDREIERAELQRAITATSDAAQKGLLHLRLGRILERDVLRRFEALREYQRAFRWNPQAVEAVARARAIYRDMGKLPIVAQLLEIELQHVSNAPDGVALLAALAEILAELGEIEKARACLVRSLEIDPTLPATTEALDDLEPPEGWETRVRGLADVAGTVLASDPTSAARLLIRAARIAQRHGGSQAERLFGHAAQVDPMADDATLPLEDLLASQERYDELADLHWARLTETRDANRSADLAQRLASRWILRFGQPLRAIPFLEHALSLRPDLGEARDLLQRLPQIEPTGAGIGAA